MCKIYNTIGSLTTLKSHLQGNNIYEFRSVKEVIDFRENFAKHKKQVFAKHMQLIEEERKTLEEELQNLEISIEARRQNMNQILSDEIDKEKLNLELANKTIPVNILQRFKRHYILWNSNRLIKKAERTLDEKIGKSVSELVESQRVKNLRLQFIDQHFEGDVEYSARYEVSELDRKKEVVDRLNSFIYGAIGENLVVKTLEKLSDEYYLINDFSVSFPKAIYNRMDNDYIRSVQIDHILVSPSGVFLFETKNWSKSSIENLDLRSPIEQVKRTSFVLYKFLRNEIGNFQLRLEKHHWGDKKVPIRNLIVMVSAKPEAEFQYVKVLTLNELISYVTHFSPIFSTTETQRIANFLVQINELKVVDIH